MNVVFDFGGVLFQWRPEALLRRVLPHRLSDDEQARAWVVQFFENYGGDWGHFDRGTVEVPELARRISVRTGLSVDEVLAVVHGVPGELQPLAGTVDLLQRLHARGVPLYYLSNMPAPYADHLERSHAFLGCFRGGVFSARHQVVKPEPSIYHRVTQGFGLNPQETVFIDDMPANVAAARSLGWHAIHFVDAAQCEAELEALLASTPGSTPSDIRAA